MINENEERLTAFYGWMLNGRENKWYTEIWRLHNMLEAENIPHKIRINMDGYQIVYPEVAVSECICSCVQNYFSYGSKENKLEIMGLLTPEELEHQSVAGYLTAEDVFSRIKTHWEEHMG